MFIELKELAPQEFKSGLAIHSSHVSPNMHPDVQDLTVTTV